jgi:hypothetical protein
LILNCSFWNSAIIFLVLAMIVVDLMVISSWIVIKFCHLEW